MYLPSDVPVVHRKRKESGMALESGGMIAVTKLGGQQRVLRLFSCPTEHLDLARRTSGAWSTRGLLLVRAADGLCIRRANAGPCGFDCDSQGASQGLGRSSPAPPRTR